MQDPDVAEGACICRAEDNIMAMGHAHYCVATNRSQAHGTRLPKVIEDMIVEMAADPSHHSFRRDRLDFKFNPGARDTFLEALAAPNIVVYEAQCEDDPGEVCVRARGEGPTGSYWCDLNIILLDPWWSSTADESRALASDIAEHWERLQAAWMTIAPRKAA